MRNDERSLSKWGNTIREREVRQKMASILINKKLFVEAKTEIELLVKARVQKEYKIPNEVVGWQSEDWYKKLDYKIFVIIKTLILIKKNIKIIL